MSYSLDHEFPEVFVALLKRYYGGKLPAFSKIARDFALHSPKHLAPISVETPRKWIRGEALPSLERLYVLVSWLGPEILSVFSSQHHSNLTTFSELKPRAKSDHIDEIVDLLVRLEEVEVFKVKNILSQLLELGVSRQLPFLQRGSIESSVDQV